MEEYKNIPYEVHVDELGFDLGFTGYAVVYRIRGDGTIRVQHLFFGEDHIFTSRQEASLLLGTIAQQYIELEVKDEQG
jgi:hypothetical protein